MALSWNFFPDGDDIIKAALRRIRAADPDSAVDPTSTMLTNGRETLNFVLAQMQADGLQVWCRKTGGPFTLVASTDDYTIGASGADWTLTRPLHIYQAWLRDSTDATNPVDIPLHIIDEQAYFLLSNKLSEGRPAQLYYNPGYDGASNQGTNSKGTIYLWPTADSTTAANCTLYFRYQRPLLNFNAATDELDMPQEWYNAVRLKLALALGSEYGIPVSEWDRLKNEADEAYETVSAWDTEKESIQIQIEDR